MKRTAFVALSIILITACTEKNHAPYAPAVPAGPSSVVRDSVVEFSTATTDKDADSVRIRFAWGDSDTSDWSGHVASGEPVSMTHAWGAIGDYPVRAQACDPDDLASVWSLELAVHVAGRSAPDAPSTPSGPTCVLTDSLVAFRVCASDPDGDSMRIRFDWGDGDTSDWCAWLPSGDTAMQTHAWESCGGYIVSAQAMDATGLESAWSDGSLLSVLTCAVHDDFESYPGGSYPTAGGWCKLWVGADAYVTTGEAHAGRNSFKLNGYPSSVRTDGVGVGMDGVDSLVYEFAVMIPSGSANGALAGFFKRVSGNDSRDYNAVVFDGEKGRVVVKGEAWAETGFAWFADNWYSVRVELDYARALMSAWVNDTLVASGLTAADPSISDTFELATEWRPNPGTVEAYFDDITICVRK